MRDYEKPRSQRTVAEVGKKNRQRSYEAPAVRGLYAGVL